MISGLRSVSPRSTVFSMTLPEHLTPLIRDELLALVVNQQRQIVELTARIEPCKLRSSGSHAVRSAKQPLFLKGTRVSTPKRPGRKPGSGLFCYREPPRPEQLTEPLVDVPVTLDACPDCGGPLVEERIDCAYTTDIPAIPRPKVTQYRVSVCRCTVCGKQVRGQHPTWRRTNTGPPRTAWATEPWRRRMGCTMAWACRCARFPRSWRT